MKGMGDITTPPLNELSGGGGAGRLKGLVRLGGGLGFVSLVEFCDPSMALPSTSVGKQPNHNIYSQFRCCAVLTYCFGNPLALAAAAAVRPI